MGPVLSIIGKVFVWVRYPLGILGQKLHENYKCPVWPTVPGLLLYIFNFNLI